VSGPGTRPVCGAMLRHRSVVEQVNMKAYVQATRHLVYQLFDSFLALHRQGISALHLPEKDPTDVSVQHSRTWAQISSTRIPRWWMAPFFHGPGHLTRVRRQGPHRGTHASRYPAEVCSLTTRRTSSTSHSVTSPSRSSLLPMIRTGSRRRISNRHYGSAWLRRHTSLNLPCRCFWRSTRRRLDRAW
jgi:hypothetical protein